MDSFVSLWVGWAGWPQTLSCDRGVHNRGVFARTLAQHGVLIRQAGVESQEQIGRVERHDGLFKAVLKRMITEHAVRGFDDIKIAIAEAVSTKNNLSRNGVFSPSQWVFGTLPRGPGDRFDEQEFADLGPLQGQALARYRVRQTCRTQRFGSSSIPYVKTAVDESHEPY